MKTESTRKGVFLVIDGPNGVGKSRVARLVAQYLSKIGKKVIETKEPTPHFDRENEEKVHGLELAQLIVEDRRFHLVDEVEPALIRGNTVVCDRYVCASLVYRALDGVSFEETWEYNKLFRIPDLNVILTAESASISSRLKNKGKKSRLEREHTSEEEIALYRSAGCFLYGCNYPIREVVNEDCSAEDTAKEIVDITLKLS